MARCASTALIALALWACERGDSTFGDESEVQVPLQSGENSRFDRAAADLHACTDLVLHEGLPHPLFERSLRDSEARAKATVVRQEQLFYVAPIPITAQDSDALKATFGEAGNFSARDETGMSLCGGFHADYALTWSSAAGEYELHACFGCYEANLHTPDGLVTLGMRRADAKSGPARDALRRFRVQRPAREW